jgi:sugar O-acyltransferase (sialic acid O-acetyltransferase NeuD family)
MKSVVIFGAGGHGLTTLEVVKSRTKMHPPCRILGFVDDNEELHGREVNGYKVLGGLDWLKENMDEDLKCVVGIGSCEARKRVVERLQSINVSFYNAIAPSAIIEDSAEIGIDVIIQLNAIVRTQAKIGDHVVINTTALIGHEATIGDYCTVAPRADIDGAARLGEGVHIGSHAVVLPGVSVGRWTTIGAGAIVTTDIPENVVAVGIPAKVIKSKTP